MISYTGNKGIKTLIPHIINIIPPHKKYIELCLGSSGVGRHLQLPSSAIGVEIDKSVIKKFKSDYPAGMVVINECAISYIQKHLPFSADTLIYADPPYVRSVRRSCADIYNYEWTDKQHIKFISLLKKCKCMVVISGYDGSLYRKLLKGWNKKIMYVSVHGKRTAEVVWYNYPSSGKLHQYNYLGKNKTDRQRIKRKISRWVNKLSALPIQEREAIMVSLVHGDRSNYVGS